MNKDISKRLGRFLLYLFVQLPVGIILYFPVCIFVMLCGFFNMLLKVFKYVITGKRETYFGEDDYSLVEEVVRPWYIRFYWWYVDYAMGKNYLRSIL